MKKQKSPQPEKGKTNQDRSKDKELQKNDWSEKPPEEKEAIKGLVKAPPSKEQPVEKDRPKTRQSEE